VLAFDVLRGALEPRLNGGRRIGAEYREQRRDQRIRGREDRDVGWRQRLIVHVPAVMDVLIERALHDPGARQFTAARLRERAAEVDPVEAHDDIGVADQSARAARHVQRRRKRLKPMRCRKARAGLDVGEHNRSEPLGQRDAPGKIGGVGRYAVDHEQRLARRLQKAGRLGHRALAGGRPAPPLG
jgi:hypothetical protein